MFDWALNTLLILIKHHQQQQQQQKRPKKRLRNYSEILFVIDRLISQITWPKNAKIVNIFRITCLFANCSSTYDSEERRICFMTSQSVVNMTYRIIFKNCL